MAKRVREYDTTGRLPAFFLFQTQFFYEGSKSRLYLTLLEDPLGCHLKLGEGQEKLEAEVREAQEDLRNAVASSKRLQAEARERGGDGWLRKVVKVHVSVTFPADLSFRSSRIVDFLPFAPDSITLDHRKLFFYDVTEEDPGRGQALFSGTGVGSEYGGPTWDDRGLLASGPALLQLKVEARRLLRSQGFAESEIPEPLRERPLPADYGALVDAREAAGLRRPRAERPQRGGLRATRRRRSPRPSCTRSPRRTPSSSPPTRCGRAPSGPASWRAPRCAAATSTSWPPRSTTPRPPAPRSSPAPARSSRGSSRCAASWPTRSRPRAATCASASTRGPPPRATPWARSARRRTASGSTRSSRTSSRCRRTRPGCSTEVAAELEANGYKPLFIAEGTREGRPKMHRKTQLFVTREALRRVRGRPGGGRVAARPARRPREDHREPRARSSSRRARSRPSGPSSSG